MKLRCCRTPDFDVSKIPVTTGGPELQTSCMQCNYKFSLQTGRGSTDAIFIISQIHENYFAKKKLLYFTFIDLEKAFDRVPRKTFWCAMQKHGIDKLLFRLNPAIYSGDRFKSINNKYSRDK